MTKREEVRAEALKLAIDYHGNRKDGYFPPSKTVIATAKEFESFLAARSSDENPNP